MAFNFVARNPSSSSRGIGLPTFKKRLLTNDSSALRYVETGNETFTFSEDLLNLKRRNAQLYDSIGATKELGNAVRSLRFISLQLRCQRLFIKYRHDIGEAPPTCS
ncbi:uncharacterized protein EAF01_008305 [Botrytis porri]|uniref:uncharacterized protein n=1 Tax=Botrytis porri TaxID=87229 RepID=UPI0018FFB584|nr:uncharacterized protein EAF01_008305 [Botrytis porri]KAF7899092.1 hypothetical protein EAF01_008305 [Botrytis porri]